MKYLAFIVLLTGFGFPMLAFGQTSNTNTAFVPLTNIPALTDLGAGFSLETFLNGLFRIAIGAAAVIAVLQIMRAGIMYMASDSGFAEKKEAKNLIGLAIGGLVLVLSPVIVFSIINPEILSLKIGGIEKLRPITKVCEPACMGGTACVGGECVAPPNGVGDGTCSIQCISGRVCKEGQCIVGTSNACTTTYANGVVLPNVDAESCCAAQPRCSVTVVAGADLTVSKCSCTAPVEQGALAGQFMSKLSLESASEAAVAAFRNACDASKIFNGLGPVVKDRNLTTARNVLYCESTAQKFFKYQVRKKDGTDVRAETWAPEDEQKNRIYTRGCAADGGTYQDQGYGARSAWGACTALFDLGAGVSNRVFESLKDTGVTPTTHEIQCRALNSRCIKY